MAELSEATLDAFVAAIVPRIVEATGMTQAEAEAVAVSAVPPFDMDGDAVVLRDAAGTVRAVVSEDVLDPYGLLESLE